MSVVINFKVCDNCKDCNGLKVCPVDAFKWDEENKTIFVDNDICINCKACEESCYVNALKVVTNKEEYDVAVKAVEDDPRTITELFCERYGGQPIEKFRIFKEEEFNENVLVLKRPMMVELFNDDSIVCLLKCIPVRELLNAFSKESAYRKVKVIEGEIMKKYGVTKLPTLLFFKDGILIHKEEGFVEDSNRKELLERIKNI